MKQLNKLINTLLTTAVGILTIVIAHRLISSLMMVPKIDMILAGLLFGVAGYCAGSFVMMLTNTTVRTFKKRKQR